jgi:methoxymalonate biosynthesis protein
VIKCVVWDLDNTLFSGVYLETPEPPADPRMAAVLTQLAGRGLLLAIASRNPPEAASYAARLVGHNFASVRCGWEPKSAAIAAIMADLGLTEDEVAFVDDDAMERAEVSYVLPGLLVLAPADVPDAASWPQFNPPVITDEARRRGELYAQRRARREEADSFGGSVEEFLRHAGTNVRIARADPADAPRLHELSVRTHQFNSTGAQVSADRFGELIRDGQVIAVWLSDKFGDDGLVGGCVITAVGSGWRVGMVMMSCRALGRGVIDALLAWVCLTARNAGASQVTVPCVINDRNVPLRIALTGAGFRASLTGAGFRASTVDADRSAEFVRRLDQPLPDLPAWVSSPRQCRPGGTLRPPGTLLLRGHPGPHGPEPPMALTPMQDVAAVLRQILAELVADAMPLTAPADTPLLRDGLGLDSLSATVLLTRVRARFGVDVADEDLNLDSLATIGALTAFVTNRLMTAETR